MEELSQQACPGGVHEETLLVVMSDHGQTLGGDHGGGTPDEVDSILLAFNLQKLQKLKNLQKVLPVEAAEAGSSLQPERQPLIRSISSL